MGAIISGAGEEVYSPGRQYAFSWIRIADYELGYREELIGMYPEFKDEITNRTRNNYINRQ